MSIREWPKTLAKTSTDGLDKGLIWVTGKEGLEAVNIDRSGYREEFRMSAKCVDSIGIKEFTGWR
jgi:hypothetical protein